MQEESLTSSLGTVVIDFHAVRRASKNYKHIKAQGIERDTFRIRLYWH